MLRSVEGRYAQRLIKSYYARILRFWVRPKSRFRTRGSARFGPRVDQNTFNSYSGRSPKSLKSEYGGIKMQ